jgi:hypothetical protein
MPDNDLAATVQTLRFSRVILVPTTGVLESCSLGAIPPVAHALRARNTQSISLQRILCKLFLFYYLARGSPVYVSPEFRQTFLGKPLGHLPSPEDGPRTPTGQSLASEMLRSELSCGPRLVLRSLNTAGRPLLCYAWRRKARTLVCRAITVPKLFMGQILTNSSPRQLRLSKIGENHRLPLRFSGDVGFGRSLAWPSYWNRVSA